MKAEFLPATTYYKLALGISAAIMLVSGATSSNAGGGDLSTSEIFRKAQETYASLTSYSDEGQIVAIMDGTTNMTVFTIRLARTNYYRIEWEQNSKTSYSTDYAGAQAVWSSGAYHLLDMGYGPQDEGSRDIALAQAAGPSEDAAATIPWIFFNIQWGDQRDQSGDSEFGENRQTDEKVGNIDCYVFTHESQGQVKTIWIGKQDFLMHQLRTVTSTEAASAVAKWDPEIMSALHCFTSIEIHTNIVMNKQFLRSDLVPSNGE
jgi:hypothetical protein